MKEVEVAPSARITLRKNIPISGNSEIKIMQNTNNLITFIVIDNE